jgi:uncharacterized PurR-regulated membrane protein YhhQ (DUF165 family)
MSKQDDRWLLPRQQTEYPARDLIGEATIHARRETTFLALASIFLVTTTAMALLGASRVLDVNALAASLAPDLDLGTRLALPFGMLPAAFGFLAVQLACELYGPRRASSLVWAGMFACAAAIGLSRLADIADGGDAGFVPAIGFAAYVLVGQLVCLATFAAMRRRARGHRLWLRVVVASVLGHVVGSAALGGVLYGAAALWAEPDLDGLAALGLGSGGYVVACTIVLLVPQAIAVRTLAVYLRVARFASSDDDYNDGPRWNARPAIVVEDELPRTMERRANPAQRAYSHAEMTFFIEGERLANTASE